MFNIPTPQGGTGIAKTNSLWPNLPKPKLESNSLVLCQSLYILPNLCKQYGSDVMKSCHNCLLLHLGRKSPCACAVESCQLAYTSTDVPNPSPYPSPHEPLCKFHIPISMSVTYIYSCNYRIDKE